MKTGIGGSTVKKELAKLQPVGDAAQPISESEYRARLQKLTGLMERADVDLVFLCASTSLRYFTGLRAYPSERLHGAVVSQRGELVYVCPHFEEQKTRSEILLEGDFLLWQEHESPTDAVVERALGLLESSTGKMAIDDQTPFFIASRLQQSSGNLQIVNGETLIAECRRVKSAAEIALLSQAKSITLQIHRAAASILTAGSSTQDIKDFLDEAHLACGMDGRSTFKIVLFGEATAYPHGVPYAQTLSEGDMVLIDTGATLHGYNSDITRSYVFGVANARQQEIWEVEKQAQAAAFDAAQIGAPCSAPDAAARAVIEAAGFGPDYEVPGLPHRTGHGVGLDVHEHPYIVRGNDLPLEPGMCFSIEPMICSYGEFGVRLEDHAYISSDGPRWFTDPSPGIDNPFGL